MWANALVHFLRQEPTLAERAIELGWADRVTLAELVDALQLGRASFVVTPCCREWRCDAEAESCFAGESAQRVR